MPAALTPTFIQAKGAQKAANVQAAQGERGIDLIREQFGKTEEALTPFIRGETPEQEQQRALTGLLGPEAQQEAQLALETPTTRNLRSEGFRSLDQRASAAGQLGGSNRLKALAEFSSNLDRQFSGQQFNKLGALSGQRLGAAQALGGVGSTAAGGQANLATGIGRAKAQGELGESQAFQSGLEGLASLGVSGATGGFGGF